MKRDLLSLLVTIVILSAYACGREAGHDGSLLISSDALLADTRVLAADEMEGRRAGTPGAEKAAEYIAGRFREIGLQPVAGSYFQSVEMVGMRKATDRSSLVIRNREGPLSYALDRTLTYWSSAQKEVVDIDDAPLLFVGYGVEAPEHDWDDFKGTDVTGTVLLFLNDDPPVTEDGVELFGGAARTYYGRWTYKFEQAMRHGAAGAIVIHTTETASYPFSVPRNNGSREHWATQIRGSGYQVDLLGWVDSTTAETIASAMQTTLPELFDRAATRGFKPQDTGYRVTAHIETDMRRVTSDNVIGLLEGSDPRLRDQVIVFSAHYDHLGKDESIDGPDKIYNGAWDNAAGTAAIINLARAFNAQRPRPRRSILFLACTAEEGGIKGSEWFVQKPPFERSRMVANFNIDMPQIFGVTADLATIGAETNTLGEALQAAAADFAVRLPDGAERPLELTGDPNPRAGSFYRSDQVSFAKAGIPALSLRVGTSYVTPLPFDPQEYRSAVYHQVTDEIGEEWNLSGLVRDARVFYKTALRIANGGEIPRWTPGNEFEEEWKALHGAER
ncbi:MAG: M20/M25/M40 family metallo-hydrolase [Gemmatimonadales bacterium]|jgi:Zn-dependent M28 family amino/carboxypeptidase